MEFLSNSLQEHLKTIQLLIDSSLPKIEQSGQLICEALSSGRKVLLCGNGGSAADAQHIAAELVGCYEKQRRSWPAIALTTDTSALTAVSNDLGYEQVFARQVTGLAQAGDVLNRDQHQWKVEKRFTCSRSSAGNRVQDHRVDRRHCRASWISLRRRTGGAFDAHLSRAGSAHHRGSSLV